MMMWHLFVWGSIGNCPSGFAFPRIGQRDAVKNPHILCNAASTFAFISLSLSNTYKSTRGHMIRTLTHV